MEGKIRNIYISRQPLHIAAPSLFVLDLARDVSNTSQCNQVNCWDYLFGQYSLVDIISQHI